VNIRGERIGEKYEEGHFPHDAIDPTDPPVFESEAAYLKRLDLLLTGEEARLPADAFDDEVIGAEDDDEGPGDAGAVHRGHSPVDRGDCALQLAGSTD